MLSLDGVHPGESLDRMLASLRQRLGNEADEERVTAAEELRRVTRSRLGRLALGDARGEPGVPGRYTHTCGIDHT